MTIPEKATQFMEKVAADQSHGYSQQNRWGPDYDCSSLTIQAYQNAGVPVKTNGATFTGNMYAVFTKCGFTNVTKKVNLTTCKGMKRGDVLLNHVHHVAVYCGDKKIVHARGQSFGSPKTGDQGSEIAVTNYYNYPWNCVLRYTAGGSASNDPAALPSTGVVGTVSVKSERKCLIVGAVDADVALAQHCLNAKGYKGKDGKKLDEDGELGENTAYAISNLQQKAGMTGINFGTIAGKTWELLLK